MDDFRDEIEAGILRRQSDKLILDQLSLLQASFLACSDEIKTLNSKLSDTQDDVRTLSDTVIEWRTERTILLRSIRFAWVNLGKLSVVFGGSSVLVFYEQLKSALADFFDWVFR